MNLKIKRTLAGVMAISALCCTMPTFNPIFSDMFSGLTADASATVLTGECGDNATYSFGTETGTLTISGTGALFGSAFNSYGPVYGEFDFSDIKKVVIEKGITEISYRAFGYSCPNIEQVSIPDTVTLIDSGAFAECRALKSVEIPDSVTKIAGSAFCKCSALSSVVIPDSVKKLDNSAFTGCTSLTSVKLPNSLTSISNFIFSGCTKLTSINIPDSVTVIGNEAFKGCTSLSSITIPNNVTTIKEKAFSNCTALENIIFPSSVTEIEKYAFSNTAWLSNRQTENPLVIVNGILIDGSICQGDVTIPDNVTVIADSAFIDNNNITGVILPQSVTTIKDSAWYGCTSLEQINIPDTITEISSNTFKKCQSLTSIDLPDSITAIGSSAFSGCTSLSDIHLPESVKAIDEYAFSNCKSFTNITIPESVTSISNQTFDNCSNLTTITLPKSLKNIGMYAFNGCTNLKTVKYAGTDIEWQNISIKSNNTPLEDAEKQYNFTVLQAALFLSDDGTVGITFKCDSDIEEFIFDGQNITEELKRNAVDGCCIKQYFVSVKDYRKEVTLSVDGYTMKCSVAKLLSRYKDSSICKDNEKLNNLINCFESYCEASSQYFSNSSVKAPKTEPNINNIYDAVYSNQSISGLKYYGSSLLLKSQTINRHYFKLSDGKTPDDFTVLVKQNGSTIKDVLLKSYDDNYCYLEISNIGAANLNKIYDISISDGNNSIDFSFSALSYCNKVIGDSAADINLVNLCKKIYLYADAAQAYQNSLY